MNTFIWDDYFITGIESVDKQHHHLVDIINKLGSLSINNDFAPKSISIITDIVKYTEYHFNDEESVMNNNKIDPRHMSRHIAEHKMFVNEISLVARDIVNINADDFSKLFEYLIHWLAYHILGIDQEMSRQIKLIDSGFSPQGAYDLEKEKRSSATEPLLIALKGLFQQVSEKNRNLEDMNITLERKVKERTKELQLLNKQLESLSNSDQLTGLKNRRFVISSLKDIWKDSSKKGFELSCMMIDADNFKQINDNYGHDSGDIVLKELANTMVSSIGNNYTVCRLGGDEFFIILPETNLNKTIKIAEDLKRSVNNLKVSVPGGEWVGSISIGLSTFGSKVKTYAQLIKLSDSNVYEAKRDGKNCIRY